MASGGTESTWGRLEEALILESKYQPSLQLPITTENGSEVTMGMRDGSAQVLRCLKVWYELPPDVLFIALNIMDRFLSRMRARPKHLSCIAISSFHLAVEYAAREQPQLAAAARSPADLVNISQAKCSAGDVVRMSRIIADKLGCDRGAATRPVTAADLVRMLTALLRRTADRLPAPLAEAVRAVDAEALVRRLESLVCTGAASAARSCELALALLAGRLHELCDGQETAVLVQDLQHFCRIQDASFIKTRELVSQLVANYNSAGCTPQRARQRLMWRLSNRTLKQLRPTTRLRSVLPTIEESWDSAGPTVTSRGSRRHRWTACGTDCNQACVRPAASAAPAPAAVFTALPED
ncbi:cyclin G-like [Amphibalanus amphitrite]|uniref:cyclin G-like n=1 Tax=Amphibalanus amphitrite TaxID=1232801 RepID=UPI001C8FD27A|nr:cyclin G-like [Amphibalanus amphitrite]XP_043224948.1 cyclin G-like [Amphibalanus amphitrite]